MQNKGRDIWVLKQGLNTHMKQSRGSISAGEVSVHDHTCTWWAVHAEPHTLGTLCEQLKVMIHAWQIEVIADLQ